MLDTIPDALVVMVKVTVGGEVIRHAVALPGESMTPEQMLLALPKAFADLQTWFEMRLIAPSWENDPKLVEIVAEEALDSRPPWGQSRI